MLIVFHCIAFYGAALHLNDLCSAVLHSAILKCIVLCCTEFFCIPIYMIWLLRMVLYGTALHCSVRSCTELYFSASTYTVLRCAVLCRAVLHHINTY